MYSSVGTLVKGYKKATIEQFLLPQRKHTKESPVFLQRHLDRDAPAAHSEIPVKFGLLLKYKVKLSVCFLPDNIGDPFATELEHGPLSCLLPLPPFRLLFSMRSMRTVKEFQVFN